MVERGGGSTVNIGSHISMMFEADSSHHMASKGGINSLTFALASELGPHGIRVNNIAPGEVQVERDPIAYQSGPGLARIQRVPLRRPGKPAEVAALAVFLASDASAYISGTVIPNRRRPTRDLASSRPDRAARPALTTGPAFTWRYDHEVRA
jgi:NAD(P)-dependent dehydrogenase (short-subunit alcohol dehydrogenase family)